MVSLKLFRYIKAKLRPWCAPVLYWGRARRCPICSSNLRRFLPLSPVYFQESKKWKFPYDLDKFETLNINEYSCPVCCESDRARLIALWIMKWARNQIGTQPWRLLDFAPGPGLEKFLRKFPNINYRSADMYMPNVDDHVDICGMPYAENSFDGFICSHVLEHVADDALALSELYRVLRPGGWGLLLVPIPLGVTETDEETPEEAKSATEATRWRRFGQGDHVRLYSSADFIDRIRKAGFSCVRFDQNAAGEEAFRLSGISPSSVLYVAIKKG